MSCRSFPFATESAGRRRRSHSQHPSFVVATLLLGAVASFQCVRATGGSSCPSSSMCIGAISDGIKVTYQLTSTLSPSKIGWMALGFGTQMPNSPMVIMWPNDDGSVTLSQREATGHIMPTVVPNPPEVATICWTNTILSLTNSTTIAFDYPLPASPNAVNLLYAFSNVRPASNAIDAVLQQHAESGPFVMDLTQAINALPTGTYSSTVYRTGTVRPAPTGTAVISSGNTTFTGSSGLTPDEKKIRTHGVLMSVSFLILLPLGVFIARFSRTVPFLQRKWFTAHWLVQLVLTGPIIITGITFASRANITSTASNHKQIGWALLGLYITQVLWGAIIHFWKPKPKGRHGSSDIDMPLTAPDTSEKGQGQRYGIAGKPRVAPVDLSTVSNHDDTPSTQAHRKLDPLSPSYHAAELPACNRYPAVCARPLQNYGHAIMGLVIISLAFHQVRLGYITEWEYVFGLPYSHFLEHINGWWISWVIIIPCIYVAGLTLLPRQWRQEDAARQQQSPNKDDSSQVPQ